MIINVTFYFLHLLIKVNLSKFCLDPYKSVTEVFIYSTLHYPLGTMTINSVPLLDTQNLLCCFYLLQAMLKETC